MSEEIDDIEQDKEPKKKAPIKTSGNEPGPHQFKAGQTVAVRLTQRDSERLMKISKKHPKLSKTELIQFAIEYTRKNHCW